MLSEGQTLSWFNGMASGTSLSETTVLTSAATMFAVPVNGFNVATSSEATPTTSQASSASESLQSTPSSASSSGISRLGLSIGITLGVVFAILLLGAAAFLLWRRRLARQAQALSEHSDDGKSQVRTELDFGGLDLEVIPISRPTEINELPLTKPRSVNELPVVEPRSVHELPQRWER